MNRVQELHSKYEDYIETITANGGTIIFTFEEWINHLLSVGKITKDEHRAYYDYLGYLKEPKFKADQDYT